MIQFLEGTLVAKEPVVAVVDVGTSMTNGALPGACRPSKSVVAPSHAPTSDPLRAGHDSARRDRRAMPPELVSVTSVSGLPSRGARSPATTPQPGLGAPSVVKIVWQPPRRPCGKKPGR